MKYTYQNKKAFTLVETLIAISILMIAVVVPLSIVAGALQSSYYARDQITAAYLAQDAMEYLRSVRDSNIIYNVKNYPTTSVPLLNGVDPSCLTATGCDIDTINSTYQSQSTPPRPLKLVTVGSSLLYEAWNGVSGPMLSNFARMITINQVSTKEYTVTVKVTWTGSNAVGATARQLSITETLLDIYQQQP